MRRSAPGPEPPIVFDCDGVLLDSEAAWTRAETRLFVRYGKTYGAEEKRLLIGGSLAETGLALEELLGRQRNANALIAELIDLAADEFAGRLDPMPGALDLIAELRGRRPLAVASNSHRHLVELALGGSNIADAFDAIVASDEVARPKPAPDLYVEACRRLGSSPEATVAIEDSPRGAAAARAAGLFVIGIPYLPDLPVEADLTGRSLEDPAVRTALGLTLA
jgi:HAD superfamily hydrolase (TIGR01509 family)